VVAFTAVPREGYDGPAPRNRFGNEGPLAAATAALYPNMEHVLIRTGHLSPLDNLDRNFFLFELPILNLCNMVWATGINQAARERGLGILLNGQMGNMTISYDGSEWLPELLRAGRLFTLAKLSRSLLANRQSDVLGLLSQTFAPYAPAWLWRWANRAFRQRDWDIFQYSAIRPARLEELGLEAMARERNLDFSYRPRKDSFASRLWVMRRVDQGNYNKGQLAGWGLDSRDPTFDKRLVEFCLGAPMAEFLKGGVKRSLGKRALADRLPAAVIAQKGKGLQAIDWHEGLTAARADVARELDRLEQCAPAATSLDVAKLKRLVEDWPQAGWEKDDVVSPYRLALLRGISVGHFARKAAGSNS
jgi:asparagine synthase (glutamine-hydrolysing)